LPVDLTRGGIRADNGDMPVTHENLKRPALRPTPVIALLSVSLVLACIAGSPALTSRPAPQTAVARDTLEQILADLQVVLADELIQPDRRVRSLHPPVGSPLAAIDLEATRMAVGPSRPYTPPILATLLSLPPPAANA
jgi:hypothetical protein